MGQLCKIWSKSYSSYKSLFYLTDNRRLKFQDYPLRLRGDLKMPFKILEIICSSIDFSWLQGKTEGVSVVANRVLRGD